MNRSLPVLLLSFLVLSTTGISWSAGPRLDGDLLTITRSAAAAGVRDGLFAQEELTEERSLKMIQDQYGPVHPALVPVLNDLVSLQRDCGQYDQAEANAKWALAIREKNLGPNDALIAESLGIQAGVEIDLGRYELAQALYERALRIRERSDGSSLLAAAIDADLGNLLLLMGKPLDAQPLLEKAFDLRQKAWGKEDVRLVPDLESLARTAIAQKDFTTAEKDLQQALALRQKALSPQHPDISYSLQKLGDLAQAQGRTQSARDYYEKAFAIQKNFLSNKDFRSLTVLHAAALSEYALGQWKEAENLLKTVLTLRQGSYGENHPLVAFCWEDLAAVHQAEHQKAKALADLRQAKAILEKTFEPDHPEIVNVEKKLKALSD